MARPRTTSFSSSVPASLVRASFGLSQQQLAAWLGVTVAFVGALEAGRKQLPAARAERLLVLVRLLPPPLGRGPAAPPALPLLPVLPTLALAPAAPRATPDPLGPPDPAPLLVAARTARLAALTAERALLRLHTLAVALAQRRQGLAALHAAPAPTDATDAVRWPTWLAGLTLDLALADPHPAQAAARRHLLAVRAAARHAEADAPAAVLG